jgi:ubiquinone biosynthesis protein COQ9
MIDISTPRGRIISAAMRLAAERPWGEVVLRDIAEAGSTPLDQLRKEFATKGAIVRAFIRGIDDEVLAKAPRKDAAETPRDVLFEVVMARLDALTPYKAAVRSIAKAGPSGLADIAAILKSQAWMLHAAGIATEGPVGLAKVGGLASTYGAVMRTWLDDDDPGHARTMAQLDRRLRSGERSLQTLSDIKHGACRIACFFVPGRRGKKTETAGASSTGMPPVSPTAPSVGGAGI